MKIILGFFSAVVWMFLIFAQLQVAAQESDNKKLEPVKIEGRVFAYVNSLISGAGVGPKFQTFVFQLTEQVEPTSSHNRFLRVVYEYFDQKNRLDQSFFDYRILYELNVTRKESCDEKISEFAYEQNSNFNEPISILKLLDGTDKNILSEAQVLPCYVLSELNYKKLHK